jgi:hypothetical protein
MIEHLKIILVCVVVATTYGIFHDQVTARVCVEYFTVSIRLFSPLNRLHCWHSDGVS